MGEGPPLACLLQDPLRRAKLDGPLRLQVEEAAKRGVAETTIPVLVQIAGTLTPGLRRQLERAGLTLHAEIGQVLSGSIRLADLVHLTALDVVQLVSLPADYRIKPPAD
jgi:hypothetical protein